ncbi:hypothetical protein ACGFNU_21330 [Spirillospora sp. NPDC048911]|uniref:VG15 protein n=1 Tax=Spirillospora sp. NPDC048911 TaxID=3364527 RepID=UPI0037137A43
MASQVDQVAAAVTAAYIARQRRLAMTLTRDLILLVRQVFTPGEAGASWAATKMQLESLIRARRQLSADLAARYYVDLRWVSLNPQQAPHLRPEATAKLPETRRPPAREVLKSAPQASRRSSTPLEPAAELEDLADALGLDDLSETQAWAELERIAPAQPEDLDADRLDANLNATGIASYKRALRAGQTPDRAVDTMAVNLAGSATTLTLEGGREVIRDSADADDEAIGWLRVPDADPCSWCAMLASRGAVYRSEQTAGRAKNDQFTGEGQFKWHDQCGCTAIPVFDPDDPHLRAAEDLYDQWLRETQGHSGNNAVNAWRRYWENRDQFQSAAESNAG